MGREETRKGFESGGGPSSAEKGSSSSAAPSPSAAASSAYAARASAMMLAYRSRRQTTAEEHAAWNLVLRAAALRFYLSRLYDWIHPREGGMVHIKDPDAYRRILEFHRTQELPLA